MMKKMRMTFICVILASALVCGGCAGDKNPDETISETTETAAAETSTAAQSESTAEITSATEIASITEITLAADHSETEQVSETAEDVEQVTIQTTQEKSATEQEDEAAEQSMLSERYDSAVGRVSLDQELFETRMGNIGRSLRNRVEALTERSMNILDSCAQTPHAAAHYCAAWITSVYDNAGIYGVGGNANDMWAEICYSDNLDELEPGMIIAVQHSRTDEDSDGYIYGHVGIYIGDGYVIASTTVEGEGMKVITSMDDWLDRYDPYDTVRWGFP